jgi:hypothetical protein
METTPDPQDDRQEAQKQSSADARQNGPAFAAPEEQRVSDLSKEIVATIGKMGDERVTCRRIFANYYRCNWWAPQNTGSYDNPAMHGLTVTTHRVRRSEWLHVTRSATGLAIERVTENV